MGTAWGGFSPADKYITRAQGVLQHIQHRTKGIIDNHEQPDAAEILDLMHGLQFVEDRGTAPQKRSVRLVQGTLEDLLDTAAKDTGSRQTEGFILQLPQWAKGAESNILSSYARIGPKAGGLPKPVFPHVHAPVPHIPVVSFQGPLLHERLAAMELQRRRKVARKRKRKRRKRGSS